MDGTSLPARFARLRGIPLHCPRDQTPLLEGDETLRCPRCGAGFPVLGGIPVLIHDGASVFAISDYLGGASYEGAAYGRQADRAGGLRRAYRQLARRLGDAPSSIRHPDATAALAYVRTLHAAPRVLVIGSGGLRLGEAGDVVVQTDVAFAPDVDAIADAHDLPFPSGSFDLVVAVAVLEHVADPQRCVAEMTRVLAPKGHVFAVTPFLQPVHMGAYDFTRFTPIGHRRLFRGFDEVAAGVAMGAGSMVAWSLRGLFQSVSSARWWQVVASGLGLLLTPPFRMLDRWLVHAADASGGCWFFGRKRDGDPVTDRELVATYRHTFRLGPTALPPPEI